MASQMSQPVFEETQQDSLSGYAPEGQVTFGDPGDTLPYGDVKMMDLDSAITKSLDKLPRNEDYLDNKKGVAKGVQPASGWLSRKATRDLSSVDAGLSESASQDRRLREVARPSRAPGPASLATAGRGSQAAMSSTPLGANQPSEAKGKQVVDPKAMDKSSIATKVDQTRGSASGQSIVQTPPKLPPAASRDGAAKRGADKATSAAGKPESDGQGCAAKAHSQGPKSESDDKGKEPPMEIDDDSEAGSPKTKAMRIQPLPGRENAMYVETRQAFTSLEKMDPFMKGVFSNMVGWAGPPQTGDMVFSVTYKAELLRDL